MADLPTGLAFDEAPQAIGDLAAAGGDVPVQRVCYVLGSIPRPAFYGVERDNPLHLAVLTGQKVVDQGDVGNALVSRNAAPPLNSSRTR